MNWNAELSTGETRAIVYCQVMFESHLHGILLLVLFSRWFIQLDNVLSIFLSPFLFLSEPRERTTIDLRRADDSAPVIIAWEGGGIYILTQLFQILRAGLSHLSGRGRAGASSLQHWQLILLLEFWTGNSINLNWFLAQLFAIAAHPSGWVFFPFLPPSPSPLFIPPLSLFSSFIYFYFIWFYLFIFFLFFLFFWKI